MISLKNKEAIDFCSMINDINQIMKNCKTNSDYSIHNGVSYAYKSLAEDIVHNKLEMDYTSNRNKKGYQEYLKNLNGIIYGKIFFSWFKENKKIINQIKLFKDHFEIYTTNNSISFISDSINFKDDYYLLNEYFKRAKEKNNYKAIYIDRNFEKILNEIDINNLTIPYHCKFPVKNKTIKFIITKKLFLNFKKGSIIDLIIHNIDSLNKVYGIEYIINNKTSLLYNYVTIVNY